MKRIDKNGNEVVKTDETSAGTWVLLIFIIALISAVAVPLLIGLWRWVLGL